VIFLWLACAAPSEDTLVEELRVMGIFTDVPEANPGQIINYETLVFDPSDDHELMQWTCSSLYPGACGEAENELWDGLSLNEPEGEFQVSTVLAAVAEEEPFPFVSRWALACEPGLCPIFGELDEPLSDDVKSMLQNPSELLNGLPLEGVSLAFRAIDISTSTEPEINPSITCDGPEDTAPLETVEYVCSISGQFEGAASVWGYTTGGAWIGDSVAVSAGDTEVSYSLAAPEEEGEVTLWLVVIDGRTGTEFWSTSLTIK